MLLLVRCWLLSTRCWTSVAFLAIRCVMYLASVSIILLPLLTFFRNKVLLFHTLVCTEILLLDLLLTKATICSCFLFYFLVTWHLWVQRWHAFRLLSIYWVIFLLGFFVWTVLTRGHNWPLDLLLNHSSLICRPTNLNSSLRVEYLAISYSIATFADTWLGPQAGYYINTLSTIAFKSFWFIGLNILWLADFLICSCCCEAHLSKILHHSSRAGGLRIKSSLCSCVSRCFT